MPTPCKPPAPKMTQAAFWLALAARREKHGFELRDTGDCDVREKKTGRCPLSAVAAHLGRKAACECDSHEAALALGLGGDFTDLVVDSSDNILRVLTNPTQSRLYRELGLTKQVAAARQADRQSSSRHAPEEAVAAVKPAPTKKMTQTTFWFILVARAQKYGFRVVDDNGTYAIRERKTGRSPLAAVLTGLGHKVGRDVCPEDDDENCPFREAGHTYEFLRSVRDASYDCVNGPAGPASTKLYRVLGLSQEVNALRREFAAR